MKLFSPAKLNLFFRILHKRSDGFHEIASLMQAISLGDILSIERGTKDLLSCTSATLPVDERNFIHQARTLFRKKTGFDEPFAFHLEKNIPPEGGFGGGSGNIATTLWGLTQISGLKLTEETLRAWAGEISSDAPFFFSSGTAYVTGRGEKLQLLDPLPKRTFFLAKPLLGLSTPLVYCHCQPNVHPYHPKELLEQALAGHLIAVNDLETPAFSLCPALLKLKENLYSLGFDIVCMTGSGTAFFCEGDVENPSLPAVHFWKVDTLAKKENEWYEFLPSCSYVLV